MFIIARIGIYSDVHISRSSSILPLYIDNSYGLTTRLAMCVNSIKQANIVFKNNNVDLIVNCGDTFNSHTLTSDEILAYKNILVNRPEELVQEWTIVGNHDKFNDNYDCMYIIPNVEQCLHINTFTYQELDGIDIYAIAYYDSEDFINMVVNHMLKDFPRKNNKAILFMHGDINGSYLSGNKRIENQIKTSFLLEHFDIIINGHIHCHEIIYNKDNKKIINIGSLTTHSFADGENHIGKSYILDTDDMSLKSYVNTYQIPFNTVHIYHEKDINKLVCLFNHCKDNNINKIILKIKCSYSLKDKIENTLNEHNAIILKYKFIFTYDDNKQIKNNIKNEIDKSMNKSINEKFIIFLSQRDDLKGSLEDYETLVNL